MKNELTSSDISSPGHRRIVDRDFPSIRGLAFLASSGRAPMPRPTIDRMQEVVSRGLRDPKDECDEEGLLEEFRKEAAGLLRSRRNEVTFVPSTTRGISLFADSVAWKRPDEIVICRNEYPSNVFPWLNVAKRYGLKVRWVVPDGDIVDEEAIEAALTDRTRVLPLSHVQFASGQKMDIKRLSKACAEHGTLLFLDAIQSLGAVDVNLRDSGVAGLSAGGYKWLCGPRGSGLLFVSNAVMDGLRHHEMAWNTIDKGASKNIWKRIMVGDSPATSYPSSSTISGFDVSVESFVQMAGLTESIRYLRGLSTRDIEKRIRGLTSHIFSRLRGEGFDIITPVERGRNAGIVSFQGQRRVKSLREADWLTEELGNVRMYIRNGLFRVSPHFFNDRKDVDEAVDRLTTLCRQKGML